MHEEQELILRLKEESSKREAFTELVKAIQQKLYWHIRRFVPSHDDANDIIQNVLVKVWQNIGSFRGECRLQSWIFTIATHECMTFVKKQQASAFTALDEVESLASQSLHNFSLDGTVIQNALADALDILPQRQKQVFEMRYYEELSYENIAQILGVSVGALKASYHHAVKKLEEKILESLNPISYQ